MNGSVPPAALLFDLGGVVIDIDFDRVFRHWAGSSGHAPEQIRARCEFGDVYFRYERAEIDDSTFFAHLSERLGLQHVAEPDLLEGWNAVFVGLNQDVLGMVRRAAQQLPSYAFTNTSPSHQRAWSSAYPEVRAAFRHIFSSAEMGMRKPDAEAFAAVARDIGVEPGRILFFDDMEANVDGARAAGLQAVRVTGPGDVRRALQTIGVIQAEAE